MCVVLLNVSVRVFCAASSINKSSRRRQKQQQPQPWRMTITCPRSRRIKLICEPEAVKVPSRKRTSTMSKIIDLFRDSLSNRRFVRIAKISFGKFTAFFFHPYFFNNNNIFTLCSIYMPICMRCPTAPSINIVVICDLFIYIRN